MNQAEQDMQSDQGLWLGPQAFLSVLCQVLGIQTCTLGTDAAPVQNNDLPARTAQGIQTEDSQTNKYLFEPLRLKDASEHHPACNPVEAEKISWKSPQDMESVYTEQGRSDQKHGETDVPDIDIHTTRTADPMEGIEILPTEQERPKECLDKAVQDSKGIETKIHHALHNLVSHERTDTPAAGGQAPAIRHIEPLDAFDKPLHIVHDGNRLNVSLEPDGMGKLDINLSLEKGVLHALVRVQDEQAQRLIESNIQQVMDALAKEGLNVGGFLISLRHNGQRERDAEHTYSGFDAQEKITPHAEKNNQIRDRGIISIFA